MALPKQVQAQIAELEELEITLEAQKKPKLVAFSSLFKSRIVMPEMGPNRSAVASF